ncbi:hypothetical protein EGI31_22825 [Lacihabitans soyangensis]|uniref:Uncharacterized protein n=2 Tax=Lacihabitans soyangensis TaxID=869394 RepID=A0AAE3H7X7_9BACT|nr:hypothetical protein [Lacihabitans soyangensis]MCP9765779.1 hypothetical protein [Lacihabitans soyangensis]
MNLYSFEGIDIWLYFGIQDIIGESLGLLFSDFIFIILLIMFIIERFHKYQLSEDKSYNYMGIYFCTGWIFIKVINISHSLVLWFIIGLLLIGILVLDKVYFKWLSNKKHKVFNTHVIVVATTMFLLTIAILNFFDKRTFNGQIELLDNKIIVISANNYIAKSSDAKVLVFDAVKRKLMVIENSYIKQISLQKVPINNTYLY